jgi:hypothetical protein
MDEVLEIAALLAARDAVGSIHVGVAERPTYDDLLRYRQSAEANGLVLSLLAEEVVLRPQRVADAEAANGPPLRRLGAWWTALRAGADRRWRSLRVHANSTQRRG